jgi:uncharacterized protein (TIGR01777 family)
MPSDSTSETSSSTFSDRKSRRILITGATGMIGSALRARAASVGWLPTSLQRPGQHGGSEGDRRTPSQANVIFWNPGAAQPFDDLDHLEGFDAVVHLAGANLSAHRWTARYKKTILDSRTQGTNALSLALARLQSPPRVLVSASAVGYYGSRGDEVLTEESESGTGFLSDVCQAWEAATQAASTAGIRVAHTRFGVVLAPHGGALKQMLPLFRLGLGGRLGSGNEWMSWITLDDLLSGVFHTIEHAELRGAVNFVAPQPVRNREFTQALGEVLHRPAVIPAPAFALRAAFGEMADAALLSSACVLPERLQTSDFHFQHASIRTALHALLDAPAQA